MRDGPHAAITARLREQEGTAARARIRHSHSRQDKRGFLDEKLLMTLGNSLSDVAIAAFPPSMAVPVSSPSPCIHRACTVNGRFMRCTPKISQVNGSVSS
jgi:hypothetical protein